MARFDLQSPWVDFPDVNHPVRDSASPGSPAPASAGMRRLLRQGSLPSLVTLEAIVRCGSFSLAAQELHLAQPTVSGHVRKLGEALGGALFASTSPTLTLTPLGAVVYQAAAEILACLSRTETRLAVVVAAAAPARQQACNTGRRSRDGCGS